MRRFEPAQHQREEKTCLTGSFKVIQSGEKATSSRQIYALWFNMTFSQNYKGDGTLLSWNSTGDRERGSTFQSYQLFEMNVEREGFLGMPAVLTPWLEAFYLVQDCVNAFNCIFKERSLDFSYSYHFSNLEDSLPVRKGSDSVKDEEEDSLSGAFSHFSWLISGGRFLIEFKRKSMEDCCLSSFVHCNDDDLCCGPMNEGMAGVRQFFRVHKCSSECKLISERLKTRVCWLQRDHQELKNTARYQAEDLARRLTHAMEQELVNEKQWRSSDKVDSTQKDETHRKRRPKSSSPVQSSRRLSPSISD